MDRRTMLKFTGTGIGTAVIAPAALLQIGCGDTKQLVKWTGIVIGALKDVAPILTEMGASGVTALIAQALPIAEKLKKAFEDNDHASTLQFLDNLINPDNGLIVQIANQIGGLADNDNRKRLVQGLLAIGMVALRLISANIADTVPLADAQRAATARPGAAAAVSRAAKANKLSAAFEAVRF